MKSIPIYKAEKSIAGLVDKIKASRVFAYYAPVEIWKPSQTDVERVLANLHAQGSMNDKDLFYTKSILVTTNCNKNDDVFDKVEAWIAKDTPSHKPTNIEHDEHKLVGHITENWVIDANGHLISNDTSLDELPDIFHIVNGAVIYRNWEDQELVTRAEKLIAEIQEGKKFVSMECIFTNFDYAVLDGEKYSVIARSADTSYMTQHLRCYGGSGECDGKRIGRLLRNITFTGKGYVDKPANPDSIIFNSVSFNFSTDESKTSTFVSSGVNNTIEENINMANELDILKAQIDELKVQLKAMTDAKVAAEEKLAKADVEKYQAQIDTLTQDVEAAKKSEEEKEKKMKDMKAKCEELEASLNTANTSKAELEAKLAAVEAEKMTANRVSTLVDGGIDKEVATNKVKVYSNLTDEQFGVIATDLIEAAAAKKAKAEEKPDTSTPPVDDDAKNADTQVLDDAKPNTEANLTAEGSVDDREVDDVRKDLMNAFAARRGRNRSAKVETTNQDSDE